jgi:hypothetical protein
MVIGSPRDFFARKERMVIFLMEEESGDFFDTVPSFGLR